MRISSYRVKRSAKVADRLNILSLMSGVKYQASYAQSVQDRADEQRMLPLGQWAPDSAVFAVARAVGVNLDRVFLSGIADGGAFIVSIVKD